MPSAPATRRSLTVAGLLVGIAMSAMEATVVATAMPTVIADLGGVELYGWVSAAYLLAATVTIPVFGKLADLRGRKPLLVIGTLLFLAGSMACGAAGSLRVLVAARVVQGLGAGALQPITITVAGDLYKLEERGRIQAMFGSVWAAAAIGGPLLGGLIVHALGWRWVFWVNLPFGLASLVLLGRFFHEPRRERTAAPLDWRGAALLALASLSLLAGTGVAGAAWLLVPAAALGAGFVAVARRAADPVLPLGLLGQRPVLVATLSSAMIGAAMTGAMTFLPLYVQGALGREPAEAGATVAAMLVGWPLASALVSRLLVRTGFRWPVWLGGAIVAVSLVTIGVEVARHAAPGPLRAATFSLGFGLGLANSALLIMLQSSVGWSQRGVVTATSVFARMLGGALGASALGALLAVELGRRVGAERVAELLGHASRATGGASARGAAQALAESLQPVFWAAAAVGVANLCVVAFWPRQILIRSSAETAAAE